MEIMGERQGRVMSRNTYKGPMDKDNRVGGGAKEGRIECGRCGVGRAGESNGEKTGTTVIEQR